MAMFTPILFLVFNRPETVARVFASIRQMRPVKLYIASDGPRADRPGEDKKVIEVRKMVDDGVDWPCEVKRLYRSTNLGCKKAVSEAVTWFFENEEEGIILEDDCLPHPTFFRFCEELLERYRSDERISIICGGNFQQGQQRGDASYYFSRYHHIWGWASWRRVWKAYDVNATLWPQFCDEGWFKEKIKNFSERIYWRYEFQRILNGTLDTWDYQVSLSSWVQGMMSIIPNENLVANIGFGADATHTKIKNKTADIPTKPMIFPLRHPSIFMPNKEADDFTSRNQFSVSVPRYLAKMVLKKILFINH